MLFFSRKNYRFLNFKLYLVLGMLLFSVQLSPVPAVSSHSAGETKTTGVNINKLLGAERFYEAGFTGETAIQACVEDRVWNGHETLGHVTTYIPTDEGSWQPNTHATTVAHLMGGRPEDTQYPDNYHQFGIAYGAKLWSGPIAARPLTVEDGKAMLPSIEEAPEQWKKHYTVAPAVYRKALDTGVGPEQRTADVVNSSWSYYSVGFYETVDTLHPEAHTTDRMTLGLDAIIGRNPQTVVVFASGNGGNATHKKHKKWATEGPYHSIPPGPAHGVRGNALGFNNITVGGLESDDTDPPYQSRMDISGYGPDQFYHAGKDEVIEGVRASVDIMAPGQDLTMAGKKNPSKYGTHRGTSYAAPLVSGGATLLVDAAHQLYDTRAATDARVIKAVLLNSAEKLPGWDNGQSKNQQGVITTEQALDWELGAGRLDLDRAFDQFVDTEHGGRAGTTGLQEGETDIAPVGWHLGKLSVDQKRQYVIGEELSEGRKLTATLTWFVDRYPGDKKNMKGAREQRYSDLKLRVVRFQSSEGTEQAEVVAQSIGSYHALQHLVVTLPKTGHYGLEVSYPRDLWNLDDLEKPQPFGLSWCTE